MSPVGVDGGGVDLRGPPGRPLHLLRRQGPPALSPSAPGRRPGAAVGGVVDTQLLGLRTAQALEGGPKGRHRGRAGPGGSPHASQRHAGRQPGQEALHHQARPGQPPGARSGETQLHRRPTRCPLGGGLHLLLDVVGIVYVAFIIDVYASPGRLEGRPFDDRRARDRRLDMAAGPGATPRWTLSATPTPEASTPPSATPNASATSERPPRSAPWATVSTTPWPSR